MYLPPQTPKTGLRLTRASLAHVGRFLHHSTAPPHGTKTIFAADPDFPPPQS